MRITNAMLVNRAINDLDKLRQQYRKAQDAVNGRVLTRASEDPKRVEEAMRLSSNQVQMEHVQRAGEDAGDWLTMTETHLSTIIDRVQAAREAIVQSGGPVSLSSEGQKSLADTLQAIRDSVMQELNSKYQGLYIFSGYQTDQPAFIEGSESGKDSVTYKGDENALVRMVAPGYSVAVTVTGDQLGAVELMNTLDGLIEDLRSGNLTSVFDTGLSDLDQSLETLTVLRSEVGLRQNQVTRYTEQAQDTILLLKERLTNISGGDLETAVLDMVEAQTAYQAALASFSKALPQSLIDYMLT